MLKSYKKLGYNITIDPKFMSEHFGITPELGKQLETIYAEVQDKKLNKKTIEKLTQLIELYPYVPQLKNYLSVAYNVSGNLEKVLEVNKRIDDEHPDYLFGLVNKANICIDKFEYDKVPVILGKDMDIKKLYPERDLFHLSEITNFLKLTVRYYASTDNFEFTKRQFEILEKIAPDHFDTEQAEEYYNKALIKEGAKRMMNEFKDRIPPETHKTIKISKKTNAPQFKHAEILNLYIYGIGIPEKIINEILELPRNTLIEDLETVLKDAENRYKIFEETEWKEETHHFALHAIFLLMELNATESLTKIFTFLENDVDFLEMWLGEHITITLWQCFYKLGFNNTELLYKNLINPNVYTFCKTAASEALAQIALHNTHRKDEIENIYKEFLTYYSEINTDSEAETIDTELIALVICDIIECKFVGLLPLIKKLYEESLVSIGVAGTYQSVEEAFNHEYPYDVRKPVYNIFELYKNILDIWYGYNKDKYDENQRKIPVQKNDQIDSFKRSSPKIGRNDPCPCGSGKKYKKCCFKN